MKIFYKTFLGYKLPSGNDSEILCLVLFRLTQSITQFVTISNLGAVDRLFGATEQTHWYYKRNFHEVITKIFSLSHQQKCYSKFRGSAGIIQYWKYSVIRIFEVKIIS